jgi:hypothetical protein
MMGVVFAMTGNFDIGHTRSCVDYGLVVQKSARTRGRTPHASVNFLYGSGGDIQGAYRARHGLSSSR